MKKSYLTLVAIITLLALFVTGCKTKGTNNNGDTVTTTTTKETPEATKTEEPPKEVTITYANWNLGTEEENNVERQMIAAFQEKYPHIKIKIADNIDYGLYADSLSALASSGDMPDVFMLQNIPQPLGSEWLKDITDVVKDDADWKTIIPVLRDSAYVNGKAYAVPFALHFIGFLANDDLFEKANVPNLEFGYTFEQFDKAVKALTQPNNGMVGLREELDFPNFYAAAKNPAYGWYSYDGEKFNLNSPEFIEGLNKAKEYYKGGYAFNGLTEEQKTNFQGKENWEAWPKGEIGMNLDGSWMLGALGKDIQFDVSFIGLPGGRTILVPDFIGIAESCENPKEAYEFIKFMTFSKEGFEKRIEIADASDIAYFGMPMITDQGTLDIFFDFLSVDGLQEAYDNIDKAMVELVKIVPGVVEARWTSPTGLAINGRENASIGDLYFDSIRADVNYADYAQQVNELANKALTDAKAALGIK